MEMLRRQQATREKDQKKRGYQQREGLKGKATLNFTVALTRQKILAAVNPKSQASD